ncbi:hypothetical protein FRC12_001390 [Ceratobasidium sp. 428]|nr:hypothetical protein FRC12_001390 [Ceratobasidium sp. 428]
MSLRETLFNRSKRKERNEFVRGSLTSSRIASERILSLSGFNDRGRLFVMKFGSEWQQPGCPVMQWYSQQRGSSTKFLSIEHRRDVEGPFFHEFLLLKLTDGAVCRVERTGEGSRADAIRYMGCTANDLIQWFSDSDYAAFSAKRPSERIVEVNLCHVFDILDVLAVCYSIQNTKACRAYTLQRYNCYFLCLTVLVVLTRRVASWETSLTDEWDSLFAVVCERWSNLSPDQAKEFPILGICAYLEPDNPRPAQFVFDMLREHLGPRAEGFTRCNKAMRLMLWKADWESGLRTELTESLCADTWHLRNHSPQLMSAVETGGYMAGLDVASCQTLLAKDFFKIWGEKKARSLAMEIEVQKNLQRLWRIEHPVSFIKLALSRMLGSLGGPINVLRITPVLIFPGIINGCPCEIGCFSQKSVIVQLLKQGSFMLSSEILGILEQSDAMETLKDRAEKIVDNQVGMSLLVPAFDRLASNGVLLPSEVLLVLAKELTTDKFAALLAALAASGLNDMLSSLAQSRQRQIQLTLAGSEQNKCMAIEEFQETYVKPRIATHAKRVAVHQLAAERFVIEDMEEAMREVWKGLPSGFGAVGERQ